MALRGLAGQRRSAFHEINRRVRDILKPPRIQVPAVIQLAKVILRQLGDKGIAAWANRQIKPRQDREQGVLVCGGVLLELPKCLSRYAAEVVPHFRFLCRP